MDKEHEIDEFVRGAIKDPDTEKKIKELYEKAYGLDIIKPRMQETRKELQDIKAENGNYRQSVEQLRDCYQRGDFETFFKHLAIPEEKVLQWVLDKVEYQQLPPEQRQVLDARQTAERRAWEAEQRAQQMEQKFESQASQAKGYALQVALERPDIKAFAESYDSLEGKPGAFRDAVCELGEYTWYKTQGKVDLDPGQAAQQMMERLGKFVNGSGAQPQPSGASLGTQPPAKEVPVIPNVGGRSTSPTKVKPKSLDDLRKLAQSM